MDKSSNAAITLEPLRRFWFIKNIPSQEETTVATDYSPLVGPKSTVTECLGQRFYLPQKGTKGTRKSFVPFVPFGGYYQTAPYLRWSGF
jgi:hypothetical protein